MADMKKIGPALREIRKERNMTLEGLALAAGYDSGNLSKFERSLQGIDPAIFERLAAALETTTSAILLKAAQLDAAESTVSSDLQGVAKEHSAPIGHSANPANTGSLQDATSPYPASPHNRQGVQSVPVFEDHHVITLADRPSAAMALPTDARAPALHDSKPTDFAWPVKADDMTAPSGEFQSYPAGALAYMDPTLQYKSGDCVLAMIGGTVTFTRLVRTNGTWMMSPLNPRYPTRELPITAKVLAVAIGCMSIFRPRD